MKETVRFEFEESINIGYVDILTYFEIKKYEIDKLKNMSKTEFKEFLITNSSYKIVDASGASISLADFSDFEEI